MPINKDARVMRPEQKEKRRFLCQLAKEFIRLKGLHPEVSGRELPDDGDSLVQYLYEGFTPEQAAREVLGI